MSRGRPRDDAARLRVLDAAFHLVGRHGPGEVSINEIAAEAGVAKQTIYRWWPSRTAVVMDAFVRGTMQATPFSESDDIRGDFERHLKAVIKLFNGPSGGIVRELLADAQTDDDIAQAFRDRFWAPRRDLSKARLERGIELGTIRADINHEIVLDAIYGPLWIRLLIGHLPMRPVNAAEIVASIWPGIAVPPVSVVQS